MHPVLFHIGPIYIPSYGAIAAIGVLLALLLAQRLAAVVGLSPQHVWNLSILALCSALVAARLLLMIVNWRDLLAHPLWMLGLAMIHNPLLAGAGALAGLLGAWLYARKVKMPLLATSDVLAAPLALALACEQTGALLAGSGFGSPAAVPWAIVYTSPLAARWSGAPLGIPVHPVQAYAAFLCVTEFWRDWEGRGTILHGALNGPQIAAIVLVLLGALLLRERRAGNGVKEAVHV